MCVCVCVKKDEGTFVTNLDGRHFTDNIIKWQILFFHNTENMEKSQKLPATRKTPKIAENNFSVSVTHKQKISMKIIVS